MHRVITRGPVNRGSQNLHGLGDIPTYPEARADGDAQGWSSVMEGDEDQGRQGMPAEAGRAGGVGERDRDRGCGRPGGCNSPLECRGHRILRAFRRRGLDLGLWDPLSEPRQ